MTTTKTLMLAATAAISLGIGAARAQSMVPDSSEGAYYSAQPSATSTTVTRQYERVPSGSSDMWSRGGSHDATTILDEHLAGAGGVSG
jgi:hypothetical protein